MAEMRPMLRVYCTIFFLQRIHEGKLIPEPRHIINKLGLINMLQRRRVGHDAVTLLIHSINNLRDIFAFEFSVEQHLPQYIHHLLETGR